MSVKIKSINLKNFRGAKNPVLLETKREESVLLYGDNGTGKSSFLDGIEWFLRDSVSHLSGEEIKKHEGLRFNLSNNEDESFVEIEFSNEIKNKKNINVKKDKLNTSFQSSGDDFDNLVSELCNEKLWIRNNELIDFILNTKKNRLADISSIVGYEEVSKINEVLKKSANDIERTIRDQRFGDREARIKALFIRNLGEAIHDKEQFYSVVSNQIRCLSPKAEEEINSEESFNRVIGILSQGADPEELKYRTSLENLKNKMEQQVEDRRSLVGKIEEYLSQARDLKNNLSTLRDLSFFNLYKEAKKILENNPQDECPLCESEVKKELLLKKISKNIEKLKQVNKKNDSFQGLKDELLRALNLYEDKVKELLQSVDGIKRKLFPTGQEKDVRLGKSSFDQKIKNVLSKINTSREEVKKDSVEEVRLEDIDISIESLNEPSDQIMPIVNRAIESEDSKSNSSKTELIVKIIQSKERLNELLSLQREKKLFEAQRDTLKEISTKFNSQQRQEMEKFLTEISNNLNSFYSFMSDREQVNDIKLQSIEKNGEFLGIGLELHFYGEQTGSAKKYLSESRINCLGLSLFLSSVILFNKKSKFFILDDVISSFDKPHRLRFGQLLREQFANYQMFILTHEREWFDLFAPQVKQVGWQVQETTWNRNDGIRIRMPLITVQSQIEDKISKSDPVGSGNLLRQYTENILKKINHNLEIKMPFRFNETNEKRTLSELFNNFRSGIKKKSDIIKENKEVADRLGTAINLLNDSSHDRRYREDLSDFKTTYEDIESLKNIFYCQYCDKFVSIKNKLKENDEKLISCKCNKKKVSWKYE